MSKSHRLRKANKEARAQAADMEVKLSVEPATVMNDDQRKRAQEKEEYDFLKTRTRDVYAHRGAYSDGTRIMTEEAWEYYTKPGEGRKPFIWYLQLGFVVQLSDIFGELTLIDLQTLVREDSKVNELICSRQLMAYKMSLLKKVNIDLKAQGEETLDPAKDLSKIKLSPDDVAYIRKNYSFTGVAAVSPFAKWEQRKRLLWRIDELHRSGPEYDLVGSLAKSNRAWLIIGNRFRRQDGVEMQISGSLWWYDAATGAYAYDLRSHLYKAYRKAPTGFKPAAKVTEKEIVQPFIDRQRALRQETRVLDREVDNLLWQAESDSFDVDTFNVGEAMESMETATNSGSTEE